jgi:hypothetical protein
MAKKSAVEFARDRYGEEVGAIAEYIRAKGMAREPELVEYMKGLESTSPEWDEEMLLTHVKSAMENLYASNIIEVNPSNGRLVAKWIGD